MQSEELEISKKRVEGLEEFDTPSKLSINRENLENLLTRRFFYSQSYSIYGGVKGLFDYGPPGCAIKSNILSIWRQHFILEENMLEIDTSSVTPRIVFQHSGHLEKFTDLMVKDVVTGAAHRADHLLEDFMEKLIEKEIASESPSSEKINLYKSIKSQADNYLPSELEEIYKQYNIKAPDTGNDLTAPYPFNLMFQTQIGPTGHSEGYLRPETAQGIFVNFAKLLEFNGGKVPFAAATIGAAFRNEIAPRNGLLRVREFTLAEVEHFVNPANKAHPKFESNKDLVMTLYPQHQQYTTLKVVRTTIGDAVKRGIVDNETLGYYMARTHKFLTFIGVHEDKLRFRQHLKDEKAHYAQDCWDAEILTSYGWIECVGIADRACYDLTSHQTGSGKDLSYFDVYEGGPRDVEEVEMKLVKNIIGKTFGRTQKQLVDYLEKLDDKQIRSLQASLSQSSTKVNAGGVEYEVTPQMIEFKVVKKRKVGEKVTPSVIEPSFGIGRILYTILEHSFVVRSNDDKRSMVALPATIAPVKCSVLPLVVNNPAFRPIVSRIASLLTASGLSNKVDDVGQTIGKRYARTDEIGVPFGVTIDYKTLEDDTVTVRERDSMEQIRVPIVDVPLLILQIANGASSWAVAREKYPAHTPEAENDD